MRTTLSLAPDVVAQLEPLRAAGVAGGAACPGTGGGLPWVSLLAFARLVTNPRLFTDPESMIYACRQVATWLDGPAV